jgi:hypothetical protein
MNPILPKNIWKSILTIKSIPFCQEKLLHKWRKEGKIEQGGLSDWLINLPKEDDEIRLVLDHALKHYQQRLKNLVTNAQLYSWKGHQQGFRRHVKEADDAADYVAGVTPLTRAAF